MGHSNNWRPMELATGSAYFDEEREPEVDPITIVLVALSEVDHRLRRIEHKLDILNELKEQDRTRPLSKKEPR